MLTCALRSSVRKHAENPTAILSAGNPRNRSSGEFSSRDNNDRNAPPAMHIEQGFGEVQTFSGLSKWQALCLKPTSYLFMSYFFFYASIRIKYGQQTGSPAPNQHIARTRLNLMRCLIFSKILNASEALASLSPALMSWRLATSRLVPCLRVP